MPGRIAEKTYQTSDEKNISLKLVELLKECPIPTDQLLSNLGLFLVSKNLSRILFMDLIYRKIIDVQGIIIDFGTRWGHNMAIFEALRGIYEPFNRHRKIVGFDTFAGFPSISEKDGRSDLMVPGNIATTKNYQEYLAQLMKTREQTNPLAHIIKHEIVKGDATQEIHRYFERNPETIVTLVYFDFDIYAPTKECLMAIKPRLVKGSLLAFDELNDHDSPGETIALQEVFGLNNIRLKRHQYTSRTSYFIKE